jgi:iron(III) transport system ATP-binding protein
MPTAGVIRIFGDTVFSAQNRTNVQPHARGVGMVFQSYALWPHMTAFDNVAFPLRRAAGKGFSGRRGRRREIEERVMRALSTVHCEALADRHPGEMSGGQQQRVALARAIVGSPRLVLMDEPLSNLDAKLRARLRFELRAIQQALGFTALYVTHDRAEAISMSDVVVVLRDGRIEQQGPPEEVYHRPASSYVSDFLGDHNLVHGHVVDHDDHSVVLETALGPTRAPRTGRAPLPIGRRVLVAIPRGSITLGPPSQLAASGPSELDPSGRAPTAEVVGIGYYGWYSEVLLRLGDGDEVTARVEGRTGLAPGDRVATTAGTAASVEPEDDAVTTSAADPEPEAADGNPVVVGRALS